MKKYILCATVLLITGCSSTNSMFGNSDLQLSATKEGLEAFYDGMVGTMIMGKRVEDIPQDTPYHRVRTETIRGSVLKSQQNNSSLLK